MGGAGKLLPEALAGLTLYRSLANDPVLSALREVARSGSESPGENNALALWSRISFLLWDSGLSFRDYLLQLILMDPNPFTRSCGQKGKALGPRLKQAVARDLGLLHRIYQLDLEDLAEKAGAALFLPEDGMLSPSQTSLLKVLDEEPEWEGLVEVLARYYARHSYGIMARFSALRWHPEKGLAGIARPDPVRLEDLAGYQTQKEQLCQNTEKLINVYPANHVLLYGPRGTGKSSMIKAMLSAYAFQGLHMVELNREDIWSLGSLVEVLQYYTLPFIIFIDDLSFEDAETEYKGFKAVLEGSLQSRPANVLIYATSNRRHLIREYHSDRSGPGEEIHTQETLQEKLSLADRFGLRISFPPPGLQLYLEMVDKMAAEAGILLPPDLLQQRAIAWERLHHGPSGRVARQFIDSLERKHYQPR